MPEIQQKRGTAVIVTAEEEKFLTDVLAKTKFSGKTITDPDTSLVKELKSRNLVSVAVTDRGGYPHGMIQPAVLVVNKEGKVIYQWAIEPSMVCWRRERRQRSRTRADSLLDEPGWGERPCLPAGGVGRCARYLDGRQDEHENSLLPPVVVGRAEAEDVWLRVEWSGFALAILCPEVVIFEMLSGSRNTFVLDRPSTDHSVTMLLPSEMYGALFVRPGVIHRLAIPPF